MIAAGIAVEVAVIDQDATGAKWAIPLVLAVGVGAAAVLVLRSDPRTRLIAIGVALAALLAAPASWAVQTVGHATGTTFPAGGPAGSGGFGGGPPRGMRFGGRPPRGFGFRPPPRAVGGAGGPQSALGGGGPGGDSVSLDAVVAYAKAHGGGTIGVSSQSGASATIIASGADVAGIGGFSGRESQVSAQWLAEAVRDGRLRWIVAGAQGGPFGGGGMPSDGRVGARDALALVQATCPSVDVDGTTVYDCQGEAAALLAAAK
jgi:hypothetical protein